MVSGLCDLRNRGESIGANEPQLAEAENGFVASEGGLATQVKFHDCPRAGLEVAHFHGIDLKAAVYALDTLDFENFDALSACIVSFSPNRSERRLDGDPCAHPGVCALGRMWIDAFQNSAIAAAVHLLLCDALLRPMQEVQAKVRQ